MERSSLPVRLLGLRIKYPKKLGTALAEIATAPANRFQFPNPGTFAVALVVVVAFVQQRNAATVLLRSLSVRRSNGRPQLLTAKRFH